MAAPSTRTLADDQIRDLRNLRKGQGGIVQFLGSTAMLVMRDGMSFKLVTAVCGSADEFDPETGEYLVRCRLADGMGVVPVCESVLEALDMLD